jgi:hypothetical protein
VVGLVPATCQRHHTNWWLDTFQPLLVNAVAQIGGWLRSSHFLSMPSPELVVGVVPATSCKECHRPNWWLESFQPLVVVLVLVLVVVLLTALCCYK